MLALGGGEDVKVDLVFGVAEVGVFAPAGVVREDGEV